MLSLRLRSTTATLKWNGIVGSWHQQWSMWFNWTVPPKSYPFLGVAWLSQAGEVTFLTCTLGL